MWITPENVTAIADDLLELDPRSIQSAYRKQFEAWHFNLQETLSQYRQRDIRQTRHTLSHIEWIEYHLCSLIEYTKAFMDLLTLEARRTLEIKHHLNHQQEERVWS